MGRCVCMSMTIRGGDETVPVITDCPQVALSSTTIISTLEVYDIVNNLECNDVINTILHVHIANLDVGSRSGQVTSLFWLNYTGFPV